MKRLSKPVVLLLALGVALTTAGAAWAYWSSIGSGSATASVGTLNPPTAVTGSASGNAVTVSWTPPTSPDGNGASVTYRVQRSGTYVCGTSATTSISGSSCSDTGVPSGTYSYAVTAIFRSWTATSAPASVTVAQSDTTPPTVGAPSASATTTFGTGPVYVNNETVTFTAIASDASGVASVAYYRCAATVSSCTGSNGTSLGTSTTSTGNFSVTSSAPLAADGPYKVVAVATDNAGNAGTSAATLVTVDTTAPSTARPTVNGNS